MNCFSFITTNSGTPLSTACSTTDISSQLSGLPTDFNPRLEFTRVRFLASFLFLPYSTSSSTSMMSTTTYSLKALSPAKAIYSLSFRLDAQLGKQIHMGDISQLHPKVNSSSYPQNLFSLLYSLCNQ